MAYYKKEGQMALSDRIAIETGISNKDSFKKIGKLLHRHPSTIVHEIKENRTFIAGNYFLKKDLSILPLVSRT
jgi:IS30 family transposase|uniref:helix-turn-helix domain-containing protein n=1 Tax=[Lactobacillus] rogosae TaxID=706562 RepID=UPI003FEF561E